MLTQQPGAHPYSSLPMDDEDEFPNAANEENENDQYTKSILKRFLDGLLLRFSTEHRKNIFSCLPKFSTVVGVIVSIIVLLIVISGCISLGLYAVLFHKPAPVIDKSYNSFKIPYHLASRNYLAYTTAAKNNGSFRFSDLNLTSIIAKDSKQPNSMNLSRVGRSANAKEFSELPELNKLADVLRIRHKRFMGLQYQVTWKMEIVYLSKSPDKNIFTQNQLQKIHDIEKRVISNEGFSDFCFKDDSLSDPALELLNNCAPINSLLTYFYPSTDKSGRIYYDGLGDNIVDIDSALSLAMSSENFYYYVDDQADAINRKSSFLRSEVLFGSPLKDLATDKLGFINKYKFNETILDIFKNLSEGEDTNVVSKGVDMVLVKRLPILYAGNTEPWIAAPSQMGPLLERCFYTSFNRQSPSLAQHATDYPKVEANPIFFQSSFKVCSNFLEIVEDWETLMNDSNNLDDLRDALGFSKSIEELIKKSDI